MKCRDVKREIALQLGHDSPDRVRLEEARTHLADCPACRVHVQRMKAAHACVEQVNAPVTYEVRGSLWPEVEARLDASARRAPQSSYRPWMPLVSVAAACLLFVTVWTGSPAPGVPLDGPVSGRGMIAPLPEFPGQQKDIRRHAAPVEKEEPASR